MTTITTRAGKGSALTYEEADANFTNLKTDVESTQGNVTAANAAIVTANTAMKAYVDSVTTAWTANAGAQANQIAGANAAIITANTALKAYTDNQITTANTALKAYVDAQDASITSAWTANAGVQADQIAGANASIITANSAVVSYVNTLNSAMASNVAGANAAIITANTAMKSYVDAVTTAWTANAGVQADQITGANASIVTANTALKAYTDAQITTANTALKAYVDTQDASITSAWTANAGAQANQITGANAAIITANTALKSYTDNQITTANTALKSYVDAQDSATTTAWTANAGVQADAIAGANAAIVTANTALKAYTDNQISTANTALKNYTDGQITATQSGVTGANAAIITANTALKAYTDNQITTANTAMKSYVDAQDASITTAWTANAGAQADQIAGANAAVATLQANVGSFYTYANATFGTSSYGDSNVATYLAGTVTVGNIASTNGYFWANGTSYSSTTTATGSAGGSLTGSYPNPALVTQSGIAAGVFGDGITVPQITIAANGVATSASNVSIVFPVTTGFSGNLVGNTLSASGTGRILANASPQVNVTQIGSYTQGVTVTATPSYTGANLNPANQSVVAAFNGNINLLTSFAAGTRTTIGTMAYLGVTATSANTVMNAGDRVRPLVGGMDLNLNGKSWGLLSSASNTLVPILVNGQTLNVYNTGNMGQVAGIGAGITITPVGGSINAQYATSNFPSISYSTAGTTYTASNIQYARLYAGTIVAVANLTVANAIALHTYSGWTSSNVSLVTNAYTVLNEDTRSTITTAGNINIANNAATTGFIRFAVFTVAQITAVVGSTGQQAAVSDGTGKNNGTMCYWDQTNVRWSWIDTNLAVS